MAFGAGSEVAHRALEVFMRGGHGAKQGQEQAGGHQQAPAQQEPCMNEN
jgi:hypothetical protein